MTDIWTTCPNCGIRFGVPTHYLESRREDKKIFYCPNGHDLSYQESLLDKVSRERDQLKQQLARKDDEIAAAKTLQTKAEQKAKRIAKRANAGVCQCCTRTFSNLARHMATKHPDVAPHGSVTPFRKPKVAEKAE